MTELPVLRIRGTDIKQSEFQRFRDETWLNDTLINCFLKKYVQDMLNDVYCFDTHFFTRLWEDGYYNYDNVKRWGRRFAPDPETGQPRGLAALKTLYVPINISNSHWIFILVDVEKRQIEPYDSFGRKVPGNGRYLSDMKRYVYDELHKGVSDANRQPYDRWRRTWRARDLSEQSPNQLNTYDCGIFTMLTIYLHSRGEKISRLMYTQQSIYDNKIRRAFAALFMRNNELPSLSSIQFQRPSGNSSESTRKRVDLTHDDAEETRQHKRINTGDTKQAKEGVRKRSAKSISDPSQPTLDQMFVPTARKKRKKEGELEICGGYKIS